MSASVIVRVLLLLLLLGTENEAKIAGYHVDDESCSGLLQNNRKQANVPPPSRLCARWLEATARSWYACV